MPHRPFLSRGSDGSTSSDAADAAVATGLAETHEQGILDVLAEMPHGGTGSEIAARLSCRLGYDVTNVQIMRRMATLLARGAVHRRPDPANPKRYVRHDGELIQFLTRGDLPLFGE